MSVSIRWFSILFLIVFTLNNQAQVITNVKSYSTSDGLSDNRVTSLIKDQEGFMWFGSWSGITRFDGHKFLIYKSHPGDNSNLQSNRIEEIVDAPGTGFLWLRAYDEHVYRFDKKAQVFESLPDLLKDSSITEVKSSRILFADDTEVWLQARDKGIYRISKAASAKPEITNYSKTSVAKNQLPSNTISIFLIDEKRNAWIGTEKGLRILRRKDSNELEFQKIRGTENIAFTGAVEDKGFVWLAADNGRVFCWDKKFKNGKNYQVSESQINSITTAKSPGKIYCSTSNGALLAVSFNGKMEVLGQLNNKSTLFSIYRDKFDELWVESNDFGMVKYSPVTKKISYPFPKGNYEFKPHNKNVGIIEDKDGVVWVNLRGQGLKSYNRERGTFDAFGPEFEGENQELSRVKFRHFYDPSGVLWLLPNGGGVEKVVFKNQNFYLFKLKFNGSSREENEIRSVYTDKRNRLWVGTKSGDLYLYKNGERITSPIDVAGKCPSGIYSIIEDHKGNIWLGTKSDGLLLAEALKSDGSAYRVFQYLPEKTNPASISSNSIYCFLNDSRGRLWAGTFGGGLVLIEYKNGKVTFKSPLNSFSRYPKPTHQRIRSLREDILGRIWVGTTGGLLIFDPNISPPENYRFYEHKKRPRDIHSLGGNDVQYIFKDSGNNMWVLTSTGGLNLASGIKQAHSLTFINYSTKHGLPSDFLISCVEDSKHNLWISTQNGIAKFSIKTKKVQNFNQYDGVPNASFSEGACTKGSNGELFFGTSAGVLKFLPKEIQSEKILANLVLTGLHVNSEEVFPGAGSPLNKEINYAEEVVLNHDQNNVSIAFTMLDYHSVDKQNYYCRLLGYDDVWRSSTSGRSASYTKLPPGEYTFQVKCVNEELYTTLPVKSVQLTILPPPWKTWWAYMIYLVLLLALLAFIRHVVLTVLKLKQGIEVEKRISELKLNFFTQVSHELRTPLTLIVNPVEEVIKHEKLSDRSAKHLGVVVKNASRMVRLVNQLLDLRKVQSGKASLKITNVEIVSFVKDISNYFTESLKNRNLSIEFFSDVLSFNGGIDAEKIDIVVYNLLANAIKFSPDNSSIQIRLSTARTGYINIEVADEGPGVSEAELKDIFQLYFEGPQQPYQSSKGTGIGLALSKELVELHGGHIYAVRNEPKGLRVIAEFKLGEVSTDEVYAGANWQIDSKDPETADLESPAGQSAELPLIVLVEDNDELRSFLAASLSDFYKVEQARDGQEGLEKAKKLLPCLVLSDVMMPRLDGIQMLDLLKNDPATSHIPVILLTAKHSVESQIEGLNYGADYYITKPFQMPLLQASISNLISRRKKLFQSLQEKGTAEPEFDYSTISAYDKAFLEKVIAIVAEKLSDSTFNVDEFADSIAMSRSGFFRKFKSLTNLAPVEFVREARLRKAKELFQGGNDNVSEVAYSVGFTTPRYFSTCFKAEYGQTPREYLASIKK